MTKRQSTKQAEPRYTVEAAFPTRQIAVSSLEKSPLNARRTMSREGIDEMKASILAHGLMQNLVVIDVGNGKYEVVAGSRRLVALQELIEEGRFADTYAVHCQIVDAQHALELSIAENKIRHAMHPADEHAAFAELVEKGMTAEQVSQRFGTTEKHVLQRLKLSRVAPKLIAEYRAGKLTLAQLEAFTVTDDQKKQLAVYKDLRGWDDADDIRGALTEKHLLADDKMAKFVGLEAYHAAGGKSHADLFGEEVYLHDAALVKKLAVEKLEAAKAELLAAGWGWVEMAPDEDYSFVYKHEQLQAKKGKPSAEQMASAGCYVTIGMNGELKVTQGLVKSQPKKAAKGKAADGAGAEAGDKDRMPDSLKRDLAAYRLGVAQAEIAKHPDIAFDLLVFNVALDLLGDGGSDGTDISFQHNSGGTCSADAREFVGIQQLALKAELPLAWLEADTEAEQFEQFRALSHDDKLKLLAYCTACTLQPKLLTDSLQHTAYDIALGLTGGEVAAYWRPTKGNFLGRISREELLEIGSHVFGKQWADSRRNAKKGELVDVLHNAFAEPDKAAKGNMDVRAKLETLLPNGMTF
jgi:ParB family chromosome partitioning protein